MSVITHEVVRPFKYGDKELDRGDEWLPNGGKWDEEIIEQQKYVRTSNPMAEDYRAVKLQVANSRVGRSEPDYLVKHNITLEQARTMPDKDLLELKGIGTARLKEIRNAN